MDLKGLIDCHTHCMFSPDGCDEPIRLAERAIDLGLTAWALTDHCECNTWFEPEFYGIDSKTADSDDILMYNCKSFHYESIETIQKLKQQLDGRIEFVNGIELGQPLHSFDLNRLKVGTVDGMCGKAAYEYIAESIRLANAGTADAVATTPINKESLRAGGVPYIGHTEIFGALTGTEDPLTMFEVRGMRVFFLTRHVSLRQACDLVTKDRIKDYVRRCTEALRRLGVTEGTMAIAGLNPHSGEHGLFGTEEVEQVYPAVEQLRKEG